MEGLSRKDKEIQRLEMEVKKYEQRLGETVYTRNVEGMKDVLNITKNDELQSTFKELKEELKRLSIVPPRVRFIAAQLTMLRIKVTLLHA